jgi:uncharacterized protein YkwD
MRRELQAVACVGCLTALSLPAPAASAQQAVPQQAAAQQAAARQACRVLALKPSVVQGTVRATAVRSGCADQARLRVRVKVAGSGPDRVVKSGSQIVGNSRITARASCAGTPRRYYTIALDSQGRTSQSRSVKLSCGRPAAGGSFASSAETAVVALTNRARAENGCRPLAHDAKLHLAAERHSADMARHGYFSHTSRDGRAFGQRIRATGFAFRRAGENIAKGQPTAAAVVKAWLDSPGHRANMLNCSFTHIGVGHHAKGPTWTQDFASR